MFKELAERLNEMNIRMPDGSFNNPFLEGGIRAEQEVLNRSSRKRKAYETLGSADYGWANVPLMEYVKPNMFNAKTLPYQATRTEDGVEANFEGIALKNYGWDESNIVDKIEYARDKWRSGDKSGGYREIFMKMGNWADQYSPEMRTFLDTGSAPAGLNMDTVLRAADYGLRGTAQKQQTKNRGFWKKLGGTVKDNLGVIVGVTLSYMFPALAPYTAHLASAGKVAQEAEAGDIDNVGDFFDAAYEGWMIGQTASDVGKWGSNKFGSGDWARAANASKPSWMPSLPSKKVFGMNINPADVAYFGKKSVETYNAYEKMREMQKKAAAEEQRILAEGPTDPPPINQVGAPINQNQVGALGGLGGSGRFSRFEDRFARFGS